MTESARLDELRAQHASLAIALSDALRDANVLRAELSAEVARAKQSLSKRLVRPPKPRTSHYWTRFGDYWRSFELYSEKLDLAQHQLSTPIDFDLMGESVPSHSRLSDELLDDMQEMVESLRSGRTIRELLLIVLDLVDSADRLSILSIPNGNCKVARFTAAIRIAQSTTRKIRADLVTKLNEHAVSRINLSVGEYPPPEITRIISRQDDNVHDDIVIKRIVTAGFFWRGRLLRKADVIVSSIGA